MRKIRASPSLQDRHPIEQLLTTSTRQDLLDLCEQRGLPKSGSKKTLATRIVGAYSVTELLESLLRVDRLHWSTAAFLRAIVDGCKTKREILDHRLVQSVLDAAKADYQDPWLSDKFLRWNRKFLVGRGIVILHRSRGKPSYEIVGEFHEYFEQYLRTLTAEQIIERYRSSADYEFVQSRIRVLREARNVIVGATGPIIIEPRASIQRIVAFSDYRVQDVELLLEFIRNLSPRPDLILYGGDDVDRFGRLPETVLAGFLTKARRVPIGRLNEEGSNVYGFTLPAAARDPGLLMEEIARTIVSHNVIRDKLTEGLMLALKEPDFQDRVRSTVTTILKECDCRIDEAASVVLREHSISSDERRFEIEINTNSFAGHVVLAWKADEEPWCYVQSDWLSFASAELATVDLSDTSKVHEFLANHSNVLFEPDPKGQTVTGIIYVPSQERNIFEELASLSNYGLCGVVGNDDDASVRSIIRGGKVFNVHLAPVILGNYAVIGMEGAVIKPGGPNPGIILYEEGEVRAHLNSFLEHASGRRIIIISHNPPFETLDHALRFGERDIGSIELRRFVESNASVDMVLSGHVHYCGGKTALLRDALVVNAASHDSPGEPGRVAVIDIEATGKPRVQWHLLHELRGIFGIGERTADRLSRAGVRKPEDLVSVDVETLCLRTELPIKSLRKLVLRARAVVEGRVYRLQDFSPPVEPRIYLDIETDVNQTVIWLIGVYSESRGIWQAFFAIGEEEEKGILEKTIEFVEQEPHASICSFSGTNFDARVLRKRLEAYRLPVEFTNRTFDLCSEVRRSLALPLKSYRLKGLAEHFGYQYKYSNLDGWDIAMMYFGEYQRNKDPSLRQKFEEYNRDDVMSLPYLIERLSSFN